MPMKSETRWLIFKPLKYGTWLLLTIVVHVVAKLNTSESLGGLPSVILESRTFLDKPRIFFYNRVPKCGSRSVLEVFNNMKGLTCIHSKLVSRYYESLKNQKNIARILKAEPPLLYERHLSLINFTRFGADPICINVVREPLSLFVSNFSYQRHGSKATRRRLQQGMILEEELKYLKMDMDTCVKMESPECGILDKATGTKWIPRIIPFFAGQEVRMANLTSGHLALAKRNVRQYYAVVGTTEDLKAFFKTLGSMFPDVFQGAAVFYNNISQHMQSVTKTKIKETGSKETFEILKYRLRFEYDFYQFVRSRFYTLYAHFHPYEKLKSWKENAPKKGETTESY